MTSDARSFAAVFHAAAEGALEPERRFFRCTGGMMVIHGNEVRDRAFADARTIAAAFKAVGDLFERIAEAETLPPDVA